MPRQAGAIHYALIEESSRLGPILEILKRADHPLSSEEISVLAYDFSISRKIMLNVSTNIGEMRGPENVAAGYVVPPAHKWIVKDDPQEARKNTFFVRPGDKRPWHDGRPRYWLIAAPGWRARWVIDEDGVLRHVGGGGEDGGRRTEDGGRGTGEGGQKACLNPYCGRELPAGQAEPFCLDAACRDAYFQSLQVKMKL
jgi:hypothetical protein